MRIRHSFGNILPVLLLALCVPYQALMAAREAKGTFGEAGGDAFAAVRLLRRARELMDGGDKERAVKMYETVIDQYPRELTRFKAYMELGKHYLSLHEQDRAIDYLASAALIRQPNTPLTGDDLDLYLESIYLTGLAHFQTRDYGAAFSELRQITRDYPNSAWADEAYYYIGMSHYAQKNWSRAVDALSRVGMFIDPGSDATQYVEAGNRLYVQVVDADMPVIRRLGETAACLLQTASGDRETVTADPAGGEKDAAIGSITLALGPAVPEDGVLQVIGGDSIALRYLDANTEAGQKDVARESRVQVVSTATLAFMLGSFESTAPAAFLGQPLFVRLRDIDLDTSPDADTTTLTAVSRYRLDTRATEPTSTDAVDVEKLLGNSTEETYAVRDELSVTLTEFATNAPVHSGIFRGRIDVERAVAEVAPDRSDAVLSCELGDEIVLTYIDHRHIGGESPRDVVVSLGVSGEIDSAPRVARSVVQDPVLAARKNLVEAEAYLELARIYRSVGLLDGAADKAGEGLDRIMQILHERGAMPPSVRQKAFQIKWELELASENWREAMATCHAFSRLYPESSLVDDALMGIAKALIADRKYDRASEVLARIVALPYSHAKAEAQFTIAELTEKHHERGDEAAVHQYMQCAKAFPDSKFAGPSLAKVIDYHIKTGDFISADDLLEQVFMDYPDADFLDSMLLKWVVVAYKRGDYATAEEKCAQLLSDYPGSEGASKAAEILPRIRAKLNQGTSNAQ